MKIVLAPAAIVHPERPVRRSGHGSDDPGWARRPGWSGASRTWWAPRGRLRARSWPFREAAPEGVNVAGGRRDL